MQLKVCFSVHSFISELTAVSFSDYLRTYTRTDLPTQETAGLLEKRA